MKIRIDIGILLAAVLQMIVLIFLVAFGVSSRLLAQPTRSQFERLTIDNGLSQNFVACIALGIGTANGLSRFEPGPSPGRMPSEQLPGRPKPFTRYFYQAPDSIQGYMEGFDKDWGYIKTKRIREGVSPVSQTAILGVDDEPMILECLKEQLRRGLGNRFVYETAGNASEAWEVIAAANAIKVIIILSDWLMPGLKGDEFLIRVHQKYPEIIKIVLTGQADESAVERARQEADLFRCLRKPWTETELMEAMQVALGRKLC